MEATDLNFITQKFSVAHLDLVGPELINQA